MKYGSSDNLISIIYNLYSRMGLNELSSCKLMQLIIKRLFLFSETVLVK